MFANYYPPGPFESVSVLAMPLVIPSLSAISHSRIALVFATLPGLVIPIVYLFDPSTRLSSDLGWTVCARFVLCSALPLLLAIKPVRENSTYMLGTAFLTTFGYLLTIAVLNPLVSTFYLG